MGKNKSIRNRSKGWQHAKKSGHKNEELVAKLLLDDDSYKCQFLKRIGYQNGIIDTVNCSGIHDEKVNGIFGIKTTQKTDLSLLLKSGKKINISLKKSLSGQVHLVTVENFICSFETILNSEIPTGIKDGIKLFWGDIDKSNKPDIIKNKPDIKLDKHDRVLADIMKNELPDIYNELINWFKDNIYGIAKLCFSTGIVKDKSYWSDFLFYKNLIQEDDNNIDEIFNIEEICKKCRTKKDEIKFGNRNGGTTIQLPFGFVQWHQHKMQFHHDFNKICNL